MADTDKRIIWTDSETGFLCVMSPSPNCKRTVEEIAEKDVPEGETYYIINATDLPDENDPFREAWIYSP
tara:strand:+ start:615 stop:821 length:207 start_codon:yes stop_codon:yes gene_type:complete